MIQHILWVFLSGFCFLAISCSTAPKQPSVEVYPSKSDSASSKSDEDAVVDFIALQKALGLNRLPEILGFKEKVFNSCQVGYGYSATQNCRNLNFTVIHIQLLCRDSEGTVSVGIDRTEQTPIAKKSVTWALKGKGGVSETDLQGYAQLVAVTPRSQRKERLKVAIGNDFLYMRANEITKVVTPKSWCE